MTQRQYARMALIQPGFQAGDLTLDAPGMPTLMVPWLTDTSDPAQVPVRIWQSDTLGFDEGDGPADWLTRFLGLPCRLLRVHPEAERVATLPHVEGWRQKRSEEHTSELQSLLRLSYAVFSLNKKTHYMRNAI